VTTSPDSAVYYGIDPAFDPPVRSVGTPRLLAGVVDGSTVGLAKHRQLHVRHPLPSRDRFTADVQAVRLLGRGGAAFPVASKLEALPADGADVVIVNGSEGEPLSHKDRSLMRHVPHLVLDGAVVTAAALGARRVVVAADDDESLRALTMAVAERVATRTDHLGIEIVPGGGRFVSGEARALGNLVGGGAGAPPGRRVHLTERGVGGCPTFLANAETFAQLGLLAAIGPFDFATTGTSEEPGTSLITVTGAVSWPGVIEVPSGMPLPVLLDHIGAADGAVLFGGYHGAWIDDPGQVVINRPGLARAGGRFGAGSLTVLDDATCPVGEIARVARWLAGESMRQCGPCMFGLDGLADDIAALGAGDGRRVRHLQRLLEITPGRGACAHPDGAVGFLRSSLQRFVADVDRHLRVGGCGRPVFGLLPLSAHAAASARPAYAGAVSS
jgi:NADH:ubiquinone oxidoreductase subunit F (NADH-binding)